MQFEEEADQMPEMAMDGIQVHFERRIGEFCKVFELLNQTVELAYFGIPESPIQSVTYFWHTNLNNGAGPNQSAATAP